MKLLIVFLSFLFIGAMFAQGNPDKYPSLTLGGGVNGFEHDFDVTFNGSAITDADCYNKTVFVPSVVAKFNLPVSDNVSLIVDGAYTFCTISKFELTAPYSTNNPVIKIPAIYSGLIAVKYYFK